MALALCENGGVAMHHKTHMVGMGCFARSQTLQQQFRRILDNYTWLRYQDICPAAEGAFANENLRRFFGSVIRSGTDRPDQINRALELVSAATQITGFYLGMDAQSLRLIVFFQDADYQPANLTVRLEKFSQLKEIRLH
jgi:hypothetical protein